MDTKNETPKNDFNTTIGNTVLPAVTVGWVCNGCNSLEYTLSVSEDDIQQLGCVNCGGDEFHVGNGG